MAPGRIRHGGAFLLVLIEACQVPSSPALGPPLLYETAEGNGGEVYLSLKDRFRDVPDSIPKFMVMGEGGRDLAEESGFDIPRYYQARGEGGGRGA